MTRFLVVPGLLAALAAGLAAQTGAARPAPAIERLRRLDPKQRQRALAKLPPQRRQAARERLERLDALPEGDLAVLEHGYERFLALPAGQRQRVRLAYRNFEALPPARRAAVRAELDWLAPMPAAQRAARFGTPAFQKAFSRDERAVIRGLAALLDPQGVPRPAPESIPTSPPGQQQ